MQSKRIMLFYWGHGICRGPSATLGLTVTHDQLVRRQVSRINGEVVEAPLKTKNAYRTLPLAEDTVSVLKEQRRKVGDSP